jgi:tight adherence protein B
MKRLRLAGALAILASLVLPMAPASADGGVSIRNVDTSKYPAVRLEVLVNGAAPNTTDFHLRENGTAIPDGKVEVRPLKQTSSPVGSVLVIDTSGSMKTRGAIDQAKAAAKQFIAAKSANDWIALVSFSDQAVTRSDFTQDGAALNAAVDSLAAVGETALWDGVVMGAQLYAKRPDLQPNVVILSDGADTRSKSTEQQATAALSGVHAAVFAIGISSSEFDPAKLTSLVGGSGGTLSTSTNPTDLTAQFKNIRTAIENQYEVLYTSSGTGGALSLDLAVGSTTTRVETNAGTVTTGTAPAPPKVLDSPSGLFSGTVAKLLIPLLAMLTGGALVFALLQIFGNKESSIDDRLGLVAATADAEPGSSQIAETGLVQRAVGITSKLAERHGLLVKVETLLEEADLALRPAEALFFYGAGVLLLGILALLGAPSLAVALAAIAIVALAPLVAVRMRRKRRLKAFEAQLPDTLNLLSGSLKAGYSFMQGVEAVSQETSDPMQRELRRVIAEARLGRPLEEALNDVAIRMHSRDFEWSVLAIKIQREVGGNLSELLETVGDTMIQRGRLRGEIKTLTAEGRISGIVMALLPVAMGLYLFVANPDYIGLLFKETIGWAMVAGGVLGGVCGFAWIQKIIKIEV